MNLIELPNEIICHISGYYGQQIPSNLSREIKGQRLLYSIKENEYYNETCKTWHSENMLDILLIHTVMIKKINSLLQNYVWKDIDKIINILWWSYSYDIRNEIVDKHFLYARESENEPTFITGRELVKFKTGYYMD